MATKKKQAEFVEVESDVIEATIIEPDTEANHELVIVHSQAGAEIEANLDGLKAYYEALARDFEITAVETREQYDDLKRNRLIVKHGIEDAEAKRKALKQAYMEPYNAFELRLKAALAPGLQVIELANAAEKAYTDAVKARTKHELEQHYNDFAPMLVDVVPFERIFDPRWLNASAKMLDSFDAIEAIVADIAKKEASLDEIPEAYRVQAKAKYFETLDYFEAKQYAEILAKNEEKARALEEAKRAYSVQQPVAEVVADAAKAYGHEVENVQNSVQDSEPQSVPENVQGTLETAREYCFTVTCTPTQKDAIIAALKSMEIRGRFRAL